MLRKTLTIALAFVGLLVGAGFASGQEVVQYFIAFGFPGLLGVLVAAVLMVIAGGVLFQLGSYYLADEHYTVFRNVTHPVVSKILDAATVLTLFCIGFVMLAGAGSNLEQQFNTPTWVGSLIMVAMVIVSGFLNVEKVTRVISAITPLIVIAVLLAGAITLMGMPSDLAALESVALAQSPASGVAGNWFLSAINYTAMALMLGLSMILVIGGNHFSPKAAGVGGLLGGLLFSVLLGVLAFVIFFNMDKVAGMDFPLLGVFDAMHPTVGLVVSIIIYLMIYNTAIGMFYALGKRLAAGNQARFTPIFVGVTLVGFLVSFAGFTDLIGWVYPLIGYVGMFMLLVMFGSWVKNRGLIREENERRERLARLAEAKLDPAEDFDDADRREVRSLARASEVDARELWQSVQEEVAEELHRDPECTFDLSDHPELDPNLAVSRVKG
ncbi:YkvI family membrane protein [Corynebacterium guangdongense]|uniref:Membrane protein YkvI n=1 Tax=Corynebacterium guangdongense TaxID=1783348 RepID=A0ABU1ZW57_9CORY|nr:hypothetical protein [Corynebacterium guangdongense]MDR7329166.1 putative membrane protein YkvI [Corynebacterium guangdongense]WJZ17735.1 hypothetical protein CGUA_05755 [Corynebacterium guangdongense]